MLTALVLLLATATPTTTADSRAVAPSPRPSAGAGGEGGGGGTATASPLAAVAFISGRWVSDEGGARSEEVWTEPAGDGMLGMWRLVVGGEAKVLELLALRAEGGKVALHLRHFDPRLRAREEKDRPLVLPLVRSGPGEARFEGPRVDGGRGPVVITYARRGDTLTVTLEKDGEAQPFTFRRASP